MSNKKSNVGGGVTAAAVVLALGIFFSRGIGLFPGNGNGTGVLPGDGKQEETNIEDTQVSEEQRKEAETNEEIPASIVVSIKEDQVTINGHIVENEDELRQYVEEYNSDTRTFVLEEDQSILETYNWVKSTFVTLDIELKNSK